MDRYDPDRPTSMSSGYLADRATMDALEDRPFGVSLINFFIVLGALLNAFFGVNAWIRAEKLEEFSMLTVLFFAQAALGLLVAFGLWGLREWGRVLAVFLYTVSFVISFISNFNEPLTAGSLAGLLVPAAIAIYLIQPDVKDKFI